MAANNRNENDFFLIIDILNLYSYVIISFWTNLGTLISLQLIFAHIVITRNLKFTCAICCSVYRSPHYGHNLFPGSCSVLLDLNGIPTMFQ